MPAKVKEPTAEQKRLMVQLIASKLPRMTIEELREVYASTTKVLDKRRAADHD